MEQQKFPELDQMPWYYFNTTKGIEHILEINGKERGLQMLTYVREQFVNRNGKDGKLLAFVLYGDILLSKEGGIFHIQDMTDEQKEQCQIVMFPDEFLEAAGINCYRAIRIM